MRWASRLQHLEAEFAGRPIEAHPEFDPSPAGRRPQWGLCTAISPQKCPGTRSLRHPPKILKVIEGIGLCKLSSYLVFLASRPFAKAVLLPPSRDWPRVFTRGDTMIDHRTEIVRAFAEVAAGLPLRRGGKRVNVATLYRWASHGCRGVRLETIQIGGTKCTSQEALQRFFDRLSNHDRDSSMRTSDSTPHVSKCAKGAGGRGGRRAT